jgi:uncharacterized protein YkwD
MTQSDGWEWIDYHKLPHWMKKVSKPKHRINKTYTKIFHGKSYDYKVEYAVVHGKLRTRYWRSVSTKNSSGSVSSNRSLYNLNRYHIFLILLVLAGVCLVVINQINPSAITSSPGIPTPLITTQPIVTLTSLKTPIITPRPTIPTATPVSVLLNQFTSLEDSKKSIDYINSIRANNGVSAIQFDSRVYNIGMARVNDMDKYGYMDHTNPQTGTCADSIKTQYGLSNSEYVAENAFGFDSGGHYSVGMENQAVNSWITSRGHRYNLLYPHSAGAVACSSGGHCVFLGLNNDRFGQGCHTGAEGLAYWNSVGKQPGEI